MEERERQFVFLNKRSGRKGFDWWYAAYWANERYVDRLAKKQREALTLIRMLPKGMYVEGVGAWVYAVDPARKVYIIDC